MTVEEVYQRGIVGAGGAGFPTHIKLQARPEYLIMNAAECEPLLHKDLEILRHFPDVALQGMQLAMEITHCSQGIIGMKGVHQDVIAVLKERVPAGIEIVPVPDFYPAGDEMILVYLTTGRVIQPGELPTSIGCVVHNVETLWNLAQNRPVVEKFITVAGAVTEPATVRVPVGTVYADILSHFQITTRNYRIFSNGLMMGRLEMNGNGVVDKRSGAIIVLPADHFCVQVYQRFSTERDTVRIAKAGCDQCNFCTEFCPRYLLGHPVRPETAMRNRMFSREDEPFFHTGNAFCCECNLCTLYACPEGLNPKGATVMEKRFVAEQKANWEGLPVIPHPMLAYRRVPTSKLRHRLDVARFPDHAPFRDLTIQPQKVHIPLQQHAGTPAVPVVREGGKVSKYDLIAQAAGTISANLHAPIAGKVVQISDEFIEIQRE